MEEVLLNLGIWGFFKVILVNFGFWDGWFLEI
jgi:hypothetical protein